MLDSKLAADSTAVEDRAAAGTDVVEEAGNMADIQLVC